ncbi:MAG: glycosyltransferase family 9 protein [Phycisphaerales bacterium]
MDKHIKKILIIKPSALGDIVLAMPAVCAIADNFPDSEIHWFVRPEFASLLENHKCVHKIVIFDRKKLGKWWCNWEAFKEFVNLIKKLRTEKYDVVFDLQGRFRSAIFAWFSGCKTRIGIAGTQELTGIFYTQKIKQSASSLHLVDFHLDIIRSIGTQIKKINFGLEPDAQSCASVEMILEQNCINKNNYAVFVPGASIAEKRWPSENFAALADKIHEKYKSDIVAVGVSAESQIIENFKKGASARVLNLAGKTTIPELVAFFAKAKLVVSNDTGPGHIATALGVPIVLIFGNVNPKRLYPYGRPSTVAAIDWDKRGIGVEDSDPSYNVKNVSVERVFELISEQVK